MHEFFWLEAGKARFLCKLCQSQKQEQQLTLFFNEYLEHSYWPQVTVLEKKEWWGKSDFIWWKGGKASLDINSTICWGLLWTSFEERSDKSPYGSKKKKKQKSTDPAKDWNLYFGDQKSYDRLRTAGYQTKLWEATYKENTDRQIWMFHSCQLGQCLDHFSYQ